MIRIVLLSLGFVAITAALLIFQPGANRHARTATDDIAAAVTRADLSQTDIQAKAPTAEPLAQVAPQPVPAATASQQQLAAALVQPVPTPEPVAIDNTPQVIAAVEPEPEITAPRARPVASDAGFTVANPAQLDDQNLRHMTWDTMASLNQATGQQKAPGAPGSLLATIVRRSMETSPAAQPGPSRYVVRPGDTLALIAQRHYGDMEMAPRIFVENRGVLSSPDSLRAGQKLVLPAK